MESTYSLGAWLFARSLSLIYMIAFASLAVQIKGLIGSNGVMPVNSFLNWAQKTYGSKRFHNVPTLFWFNSSDRFLEFVCWTGFFFSALSLVGLLQSPSLLVALICYMSLVSVGQDFLSFQWDVLLLEAGFLALFLAPFFEFNVMATAFEPPTLILALYWWLLFRLHFSSGIVKLASRDKNWRNLTALKYHFETQPLPNPISRHVHNHPLLIHKISALLMFAIEIIVPWCIFIPGKTRIIAAAILVLFQLLIFLTGNYCFFNLLTMALCFLLLKNSAWTELGFHFGQWLNITSPASFDLDSNGPYFVIFFFDFVVSLFWILSLFSQKFIFQRYFIPVVKFLLPYKIVNSYGLFAIMTTSRPEIIFEGSIDGKTWLPYEFKWKPGDLKARPRQVAPYHPRLDWQLWFAALGTSEENIWVQNLCIRLLQGEVDVLKLIGHNPFPKDPPKHLRAVLYEYKFTTPSKKKVSGHFWKRNLLCEYSPTISLESEQI